MLIQTWGDQNEGQKIQYVVKVKVFRQVLFVFWIKISVPRLISLTLVHISAVENHWFEFRPSLYTTVEPGLSKHGNHRLPNIIQKSTLLIVKHFKQPCWHVHRNGKLDCTGQLHQVCVFVFMSWICLWSGNFTKCQWRQYFIHLNLLSYPEINQFSL